MTIYGIQNGELTTSKTCNRDAVLKAIEADGHAWGVATPNGRLIVVNKSQRLAEKARSERQEGGQPGGWTLGNYTTEEREGMQVIKVYAGKAAATAAISNI